MTDDVREKAVAIAAQIVSATDPIRNIRLDEVDIIESALREARNAALEEALEIAEECAQEDPGYPETGSASLARAMMRIRALKDKTE